MLRLHTNLLECIEDLTHLKPLAKLKRLTLMSNPIEVRTTDRSLTPDSAPAHAPTTSPRPQTQTPNPTLALTLS